MKKNLFYSYQQKEIQLMKVTDEMIQRWYEIKKELIQALQRKERKKRYKKQYLFGLRNNQPTLYQEMKLRKKRINKRKNPKVIKRFNIELINISETIKELIVKKNIHLEPTTDFLLKKAKVNKKKKVTQIRKVINEIRTL